jgi:D-tagatose-bisphosphate aldolase class II non-catalytic subunit
MLQELRALSRRGAGEPARGIVSVCSAHAWVIEATFRHACDATGPVLIEATCNQVNQFGGYTGMTPADFRRFVEGIAASVGFPLERLILGGDHLGPNPWRDKPAELAMQHAEAMVVAYVEAGFGKIHLDASMGCAGEPEAVGDSLAADRAARLAAAAEVAADRSGAPLPLYIIGTEVPTPGGALEALDHVVPTSPEAAIETHRIHADAFAAAGLVEAFSRVVGLVVQPGVEFGDADVMHYRRKRAADLSAALGRLPGLTFEAHSTDYQNRAELAALVDDGFCILKVGPWLTFALREALYGLDAIAMDLGLAGPDEGLKAAMERLLLAEPKYWQKYYAGDADTLRVKRHYSFSDRIRYYWPHPDAQKAVADLFHRLEGATIPFPLISQHLGQIADRAALAAEPPTPKTLVFASISRVLDLYAGAARVI